MPLPTEPLRLSPEAAFRLAGEVHDADRPAGIESLWRRYVAFLDREEIHGEHRRTAVTPAGREEREHRRAQSILVWIAVMFLIFGVLARRASSAPPAVVTGVQPSAVTAIVPVHHVEA